jgi:hypothetical protein
MTQEPRPKRRRGGQRKPASERKRNNLTFRARDQLKADLEKAAAANNRSVSEQIEHYIERAIEWEKVLGDLESFKAKVAEEHREALRQSEAAARHRAGWGKMYDPKQYDPKVPGSGVVWFPPGTHNIPQSGFTSEEELAAPPQPTLPPIIRQAVRVEVQTAVREILEEAGLLRKRKPGSAAV